MNDRSGPSNPDRGKLSQRDPGRREEPVDDGGLPPRRFIAAVVGEVGLNATEGKIRGTEH